MLDLYPHNLQAYNSAVKAFETTNRTCIIHPTGTGKSLIIANFIENNPGKKHLLLAPGKHIFDEIKKHTVLDFKTSTYQNLIFNSAESLDLLNCDFIYLDEFHRIGAVEWGQYLNILLQLNPQALILGTTATHIRYLDDNRDMAEEIFNNNISSSMTLHEAIQSKILKAPKYISALYNVKDVTKDLYDKVLKSDHLDKLIIADDLDKKLIDWENSNGIDKILSKHLTIDRNKILVFCRTKAHIHQMEEIIMNGIRKVMPDAISLHIYSKYGSTINDEALRIFAFQDEIPKVLFTVAMVNEGLHVKGNNTVILIRDTTSPIIYYQQIGRAFSVNQTQKPLIFDLVNNFDSITGSINHTEGENITDGTERTNSNRNPLLSDLVEVEFIDEIKDLAQMFSLVYKSIKTWEIRLQEAKVFYEINGHLRPEEGSSFYNWISSIRTRKTQNSLSLNQIDEYESIGMIWNLFGTQWSKNFEKAKLFYQTNGHLNLKRGTPLNAWLVMNRTKNNANTLSQERIGKLDSIGMDWNPIETQWNKNFENCKLFYIANGHLLVKKGDPLYTWIITNRGSKTANTLSQERIDKFDSVGMDWNPDATYWNINYDKAKLFYKTNGHLNTTGSPINGWIISIRGSKAANTLSQERIDKFDSIGMDWNPIGNQWNENFEKAEHIYRINGHLILKKGTTLLYWISTNRKNRSAAKLSQERIDKLDSIGIDWGPYENQWNKNFEDCKLFYKTNGHLDVKEGSPLYGWIVSNKTSKAKNTLGLERISKLESIGIIWNRTVTKWNKNFEEAKLFYINGDTYPKPGSPLYNWILAQKKKIKNNKLSIEEIQKLKSIGIE